MSSLVDIYSLQSFSASIRQLKTIGLAVLMFVAYSSIRISGFILATSYSDY